MASQAVQPELSSVLAELQDLKQKVEDLKNDQGRSRIISSSSSSSLMAFVKKSTKSARCLQERRPLPG